MTRYAKFLGAALLVTLAACSSGGSSPEPSPGPSPTPVLPLNGAGMPVVARVNGQDITLPQYERALARAAQNSGAADLNALAVSVLDTLIEQALINQAAAALNIVVTDEEVNQEYEISRSLLESDQAWQEWLDLNLYTEEEYRESLREALLTNRLLYSVTGVEGQEIIEIHARHILVSTEAEANAVITRLQAGEDFAALAQELSNDVTTRDQGGDLGWFIREDLTTPELADVAVQLEPGQIAGPIPTLLGYHIIQTLEKNRRQVLPEDEFVLVRAQFDNWLEQQLEAATIERFWS